jgi:hypothetical protein
VNGLVLASGQEVEARLVLSSATPEVTFNRFPTCIYEVKIAFNR